MSVRALTVLFVTLVTPSVFAAAAPKAASPIPLIQMGKSSGAPNQGKLVGGAHLNDATYLRIVPAYAGGDVRWGLGTLVGMLDRAGRSIKVKYPASMMSVGHLSKQGGGEIPRHASHETGRDVDIAFFVKNVQGNSIYADHFVAFKGDGTAPTWPGAQFDDAKNWALCASVLNDPVAHVSHIFVSIPIRARLLAYAQKVGASPALLTRAAETMLQPHGSLPHDDHFHVRISCPPGMAGCIENPIIRIAKKKPLTVAAIKPVQTTTAKVETPKVPVTKASDPRETPKNDDVSPPAVLVEPLDE